MSRSQAVRAWVWAIVVIGSVGAAGQDDNPSQKIHEQTARSFVVVSYHLKKSDRPQSDDLNNRQSIERKALQWILNKNTADAAGVIVSDKGDIFTSDRVGVAPEMIERITVRGADGGVMPARFGGLLTRAAGQILQVEGDLPAGWRPLQFAEAGEVTARTKLYAAVMTSDGQYQIVVSPCRYGYNWDSTIGNGPGLQTPGVSGAGVVCNEQGQPVGVTCREQIDLGPAGPVWRGRDILADPGFSDQQLGNFEHSLRTLFAQGLYQITITCRPRPQEDREYDLGDGFPYDYWFAEEDEENPEMLMYGLACAENRLLVPHALPEKTVEGIDTITVKVKGKSLPGRFVGVLKQCGATVIELQEGKLPWVAVVSEEGRLARIEPFWAVFAREMAGKDLLIERSRWIDKAEGYGDLWYPMAEQPLRLGSWLVNRQCRLVGLFTENRHECEQIESYLMPDAYAACDVLESCLAGDVRRAGGFGWRDGFRNDAKLFEAAELAGMLSDLPGGCDPHICRLDRDEQRRRVWLGVEFTAMDKEMAKSVDLRGPTQDGRIGLVVNCVYAGSPAAELGLTEGDVLLKVAVPGAPWPIELADNADDESDDSELSEEDLRQGMEMLGKPMPRKRPWPSRDNFLTRLLGDVGAGTTVRLSCVHGGQAQEKEFTIRQAPRDMLSAARYKDDKLGLTVKDATYEVRAALHLKPDEPAVVVTKVQPGTPTALARIESYELIRAIDGEPVDGVATFEKLIAEAQKQDKKSVRLTVEWMGQTRLADLKFDSGGVGGMLKSLLHGQ